MRQHVSMIKSILCLLMLITATIVEAQITVRGVVTSATTHEPLIGAVIKEINNERLNATVTDYNGEFVLEVMRGADIECSYLGYKTYIYKHVSSEHIDIRLIEKLNELEDVIVLGTKMRKSDLTGAIGGLTDKQLKEIPSSNFIASMQGKVAGVYIANSSVPGVSSYIKVRGNNSINYGTSPIFVIDGIIVDEGLNNINPDDIASIEVLKDASAKAIYGYRASNGVILVTTKHGQKGEGKINYSGWVGFSSYDKGNMEVLGAKDLYDLRLDAWVNQYTSDNPGTSQADLDNYVNNVLLGDETVAGHIFSDEERYNGLNNITSDWVSPITRSGLEHNHSLSFSNATDKFSNYLSLSYTNQKGIIVNSGYERFGLKYNGEYEVKPWLRVGTNTTISRGVTDYQDGGLYTMCLRANPMQCIDDRDYMYWNGGHDSSGNPLNLMKMRNEQTHDRILTANYININPLEGLNIRTTFSVDYLNKIALRYSPTTADEASRLNNGYASHWRGNSLMWQWDNSISYEKIFDQKHRIFAMVTANLSRKSFSCTDIGVSGFPSDILGWNNIGAAANKERASYSSYFDNMSSASFVQRIHYSYDNRYMLTMSLREDGSSRFAEGHRWGVFPSLSAAWYMNEESFLSDVQWLNNLKLRAGWGLVGNQEIPNYAYLSMYNPVYSNGSVSFVSDGRMGNPDISWEKQNQFNVGVDAGFWDDRLSLSADYFYTINSDLLMQISLSPTIGFKNRVANVAKLENQGVEFSMNARLIDTKNWKWNLSANISHDRNIVKELYDGLSVVWAGNSITSREWNLFVGQPVNTYYAFKTEKIAQESDMDRINEMLFVGGKKVSPGDILPVDKNNDKKITYEDDMFIIGRKDPTFYGGFSTDLQWKDFSLSASFSYSYGARRHSWLYENLMNLGAWEAPSHVDALKRWTPTNTDTDIPRAFRGGAVQRFNISDTDFALCDASYLRLSALTLAYDCSAKAVRKVCDRMRLYVTANNLFTLTKYRGYDPETGDDYPLSRMFVVGVNLTF